MSCIADTNFMMDFISIPSVSLSFCCSVIERKWPTTKGETSATSRLWCAIERDWSVSWLVFAHGYTLKGEVFML